MFMKSWLVKTGTLLAILLASVSFADSNADQIETISLGGANFTLNPQAMESVSLNGWRNVQKLFVNATGNGGEGMFEVVVNGDVKGTIHVPGRDPLYVVTVNEVTSSIQFRHLSGRSVWIQGVSAVQSVRSFSTSGYPEWTNCERSNCVGFHASNEASNLALRAIRLVDKLQGFTDYQNYGIYLLPIKKTAARAYAAADARGPLSGKVRELLICLQAQIAYAKPYIENTFERTFAFEFAVELLSLEYKLQGGLI